MYQGIKKLILLDTACGFSSQPSKCQSMSVGKPLWPCCSRRSTQTLEAYAQDLLSRRLPPLARMALRGAETPVTPTGQESVRGTNPIMVESVLRDSFPLPVCAPLPLDTAVPQQQ